MILFDHYKDICVEKCPNTTYLFPTSTSEVLCPYNVTNTTDAPCYGTLASRSGTIPSPFLHLYIII